MTTVLITGATGKHGGFLIRNLVQRKASFEIPAVIRDPASASAQKLAKLSTNIKLVQGDLGNPVGIFQNAQQLTKSPIWGVYSVQAAIGNSDEETQGKALMDESIKQKVKFFVYSSVDHGGEKNSFKNSTKIPHSIKKHNIEHHLVGRTKKARGNGNGESEGRMEWTILRPAAFYENLTPDFFGKVFVTCFKMSLAGKPLQLRIFLKPEEYKGRAISLAGDELTFDGMNAIFQEKMGKTLPITFRPFCSLFMATMKDMGYVFSLRVVNPEMKDFLTWLEKESGFRN
ncbi:nmrA-like family protein [Aspergillus filifer]